MIKALEAIAYKTQLPEELKFEPKDLKTKLNILKTILILWSSIACF